MGENKNTIWIAMGLGVVGLYLYMKSKKKVAAPVAPTTSTTTTKTTAAPKSKYPMGIGKDGSYFELKDGDYVANGQETAVLYNGELRPITAAYANTFAYGTWDRTKILDNIVYSSIPRGAVLDA
jgi:hypothetical protein